MKRKELWNDKTGSVSAKLEECEVRRAHAKTDSGDHHSLVSATAFTETLNTTEIALLSFLHRWKNLELQTLMSRILCLSNSSMVSSSCLVVRVASMVALCSSLSAWGGVQIQHTLNILPNMRPTHQVVAKVLFHASSFTCSNFLDELFSFWHMVHTKREILTFGLFNLALHGRQIIPWPLFCCRCCTVACAELAWK